jgi:hypothetical protein
MGHLKPLLERLLSFCLGGPKRAIRSGTCQAITLSVQAGLEDAPYDATFSLVFHAFSPEDKIRP